jgi:integrase
MTTMPIHKLTPSRVAAFARERKQGLHSDGGNLYLQIDGGSASWVFRFKRFGCTRYMGLGPLHTVTLSEARDLALAARKVLHQGRDPLAARKAKRQAEAGKAITFDAATAAYLKAHKAGWKNPVHRDQWESTLRTYASPVFGSLPVGEVGLEQVLRAIEPIWQTKNETAARLRGRIERVLDWATVKGFRTGDNPARWKGHLDQLLPARSAVHKVRHHPALPYAELPAFLPKLRAADGIAARALEFLILTSTRTGDLCGNDREDRPPLKWTDLDLDRREWLIPGTKTDVEHKVPLSRPAIAVLERVKALALPDDIVFPGDKPGEPLSNGSMLRVLDRMPGYEQFTPHGFRATFKTWAGEETSFAREVIEAVLAHGMISDDLERAYRRADFFAKRRRLMDAWASYAGSSKSDNVVALGRRR